ncbi:MAG: nuclear transport factor 2 family protein [Chloroflexota bacterium]
MITTGTMTTAAECVIQAQYTFWDALKNKDREAFELVLAEDFVSRSPDEPDQARSEFIKALTSFPALVVSVRAENLDVHIFGETAVLSGVQVARIQFVNMDEINNRVAITNLFRLEDEQWRMVFAHAIDLSVAAL